MRQSKRHEPPHVYLDDTWYFITASIFKGAHYLASDRAKALLLKKIQERVLEYGFLLFAWVILHNHYHLLIQSRLAADIPRFFQRLHAGFAFELNNLENQRGRKVWHSYWDTCIQNDRDFWTRFNYIHNNPIKHGYVRQSRDWAFSSYHEHLAAKGEAWLLDCFRSYPVLSYMDSGKMGLMATGVASSQCRRSGFEKRLVEFPTA